MALTRRIVGINSSGTIAEPDAAGWGCTRTAVGTYNVTFPGTLVASGAALCILVSPTGGTLPLWARFSNNTTTGTTVGIYNQSGTLTDSSFALEMCADFI